MRFYAAPASSGEEPAERLKGALRDRGEGLRRAASPPAGVRGTACPGPGDGTPLRVSHAEGTPLRLPVPLPAGFALARCARARKGGLSLREAVGGSSDPEIRLYTWPGHTRTHYPSKEPGGRFPSLKAGLTAKSVTGYWSPKSPAAGSLPGWCRRLGKTREMLPTPLRGSASGLRRIPHAAAPHRSRGSCLKAPGVLPTTHPASPFPPGGHKGKGRRELFPRAVSASSVSLNICLVGWRKGNFKKGGKKDEKRKRIKQPEWGGPGGEGRGGAAALPSRRASLRDAASKEARERCFYLLIAWPAAFSTEGKASSEPNYCYYGLFITATRIRAGCPQKSRVTAAVCPRQSSCCSYTRTEVFCKRLKPENVFSLCRCVPKPPAAPLRLRGAAWGAAFPRYPHGSLAPTRLGWVPVTGAGRHRGLLSPPRRWVKPPAQLRGGCGASFPLSPLRRSRREGGPRICLPSRKKQYKTKTPNK